MMSGVDTGTALDHARELVEETTSRRASAAGATTARV
jgi:DNA repair protein RecN (Recombination protein N)